MTSRRPLAAAATLPLLSALLTGLLAAPAQAADTTVTFNLAGGSLGISAPGTADLGSAAAGAASLAGQLGAVTVTDNRGAAAATWTASVESTVFTTGGGTGPETVARNKLAYSPGATTASSPATGTFVPAAGLLGGVLPAYTGAAVGNNSATWNPTLTIDLSAQKIAGAYSGTVTHSVS